VNDAATFTNAGTSATALTGNLTMTATRLDCANSFATSTSDPWSLADWFNGQVRNGIGTADLTGFVNGPLINAVVASTFSDSFFDSVSHIGAVKDQASDWTAKWIFRD